MAALAFSQLPETRTPAAVRSAAALEGLALARPRAAPGPQHAQGAAALAASAVTAVALSTRRQSQRRLKQQGRCAAPEGQAEPEPAGTTTAASIPEGWQEVLGSSVLFPLGKEPVGVVHFLGGAFVGASPKLFYQSFLERLAEEAQVVVVATPYQLAFDYDTTASKAALDFQTVRDELSARGLLMGELESSPPYVVGHSCGALLHALLAVQRPTAACVLMSFNNRPVSEAVPVELPPSPPDEGLRDLVSGGLESALDEQRVASALRAGARLADMALGAVGAGGAELQDGASAAAPVVAQLGPLLGSVVQGERDFTVSQEEIAARLSGVYGYPRTLLVQFANDLTDETQRIAEILGKTGSEVVELRMPAGHTAPVDLPGLGNDARIRGLAGKVGRFLRGEAPEPPSEALPELKARLLRLTAGTNRGFSLTTPARRQEILDCVEEIEALGTPARDGTPPPELFGKWRLVWSTSPDVLLLAALPLLDCGEIRQDIPAGQDVGAGPLEVFNSVELSPRGLGLLGGALPGLARAASVKTVVRALAEPRDGGNSFAIRFEGGRIEPGLPGLPTLPLPELPSIRATSSASGGTSIRLLTSFLDSDFRFARSPLGDVFVLARAD